MHRVFLDTNVFKLSATKQRRLIPSNRKTLDWMGNLVGVELYRLGYLNPNEGIRNTAHRQEAELLQSVAEAVKSGHLEAVTEQEVLVESWGIPGSDSVTGQFYGASVSMVTGHAYSVRSICGNRFETAKEAQRSFLVGIEDPRYIELRKATGAWQGDNEPSLNQMADAFHVWCAECTGCDYFLTLDYRLIRMVMGHKYRPKTMKLVKPSTLLQELEKSGGSAT